MAKKLSLTEAWEISLRFRDSFTRHLFRYLCIREGVMLEVYKDSKGLDTVGIGHRVYPGDKKPVGSNVSQEYVIDTFKSDMVKERSVEMKEGVRHLGIPGGIGVASFCWTHGPGQFANSFTQKLAQTSTTSEATLQAWVKKNWDLSSPVNQSRNRADLELMYPRKSGGIIYHASFHSSGNFVYIPALDESYPSLDAALTDAKKKMLRELGSPVIVETVGGSCRWLR